MPKSRLSAAIYLSVVFLSGALVGGLALAVFWPKGRALPVVAGMLVSLCVMTAIQLLPQWSLTKELWMRIVGTAVFWPWFTLIGATVTLGTAMLVQKCGPIRGEQVLQDTIVGAEK